jgi:DNA invertase Pin-like site-specific DNA recombinase
VVIAPKLDRLFRSALDALTVVEDMRKRGVSPCICSTSAAASRSCF